jgi:hypothetical protein
MRINWISESKLDVNRKTGSKKDINIFIPPTFGISPWWEVLLFGLTTKLYLLAISITTGINK